jgi:hypothetical protein
MVRIQKVVPFAVAGIITAGLAALIVPLFKKSRNGAGAPEKVRSEGGAEEGGLYCDVPEGADICYPK